MSHILIVEDDEIQLTLLGRNFRSRGYTVVCAGDAVEALHALLCETFDLILSDIRMPYLDGFEFLKAVRGDVRTSRLPVVFFSGQSDPVTMARAHRAGATAFIAKPCDIAQVEKTVAAILDGTGESSPKRLERAAELA